MLEYSTNKIPLNFTRETYMNKNFINEIEIKNYKCFKNFKTTNFSRINLISGKNNVGKTAFLEACYINVYSHNSMNNPSMALSDIIFTRYNQVILQDLLLEKGIGYISRELEKQVIAFDGTVINSNLKEISCKYTIGDFSIRDKSQSIKYFLGNNQITNDKLEESYGKIIELAMEKEIDDLLKHIDNNIKSFRIINSQPKCNFYDDTKFRDIHELGDGFYKYVSILCALFICKDSQIFIDEIDNGIHFTNFDKLWEVIFHVATQQNVQVFTTTHSKECIDSYVKVSQKLSFNDINFIELGKDKENTIKSNTMNFAKLQRNISLNNGIRGW